MSNRLTIGCATKPNDFWYTPQSILDCVKEFLGDDYFDPCPVSPEFDGLKETWLFDCFINPPYSRALKRAFIKKGIEQYEHHNRYLWLMNYANTVDMWDLYSRASAICIPEKRVQFVAGHPDLQAGSPMYDNVFVLWGEPRGFAGAFNKIGKVVSSEYRDNDAKP